MRLGSRLLAPKHTAAGSSVRIARAISDSRESHALPRATRLARAGREPAAATAPAAAAGVRPPGRPPTRSG